MEIKHITRHGTRIDVLFTGGEYVFTSEWYGVLAVAKRKGYATDEEHNTFTISYGNKIAVGCSSLGGKTCYEIAKQYISKEERVYIADKKLAFTAAEEDTSLYALDLRVIKC